MSISHYALLVRKVILRVLFDYRWALLLHHGVVFCKAALRECVTCVLVKVRTLLSVNGRHVTPAFGLVGESYIIFAVRIVDVQNVILPSTGIIL